MTDTDSVSTRSRLVNKLLLRILSGFMFGIVVLVRVIISHKTTVKQPNVILINFSTRDMKSINLKFFWDDRTILSTWAFGSVLYH